MRTDGRARPDTPSPPVAGGRSGYLGQLARLVHLAELRSRPIELMRRLRREYGSVFTISVPFQLTPSITFLTSRRGYDTVLGLNPEIGTNGPVIAKLPLLNQWIPRSDASPEHLQQLLLVGRQFIAGRLLAPERMAAVPALVEAGVHRHVASWAGTTDLSRGVVELLHDLSGRCVLGAQAWERLAPDVLPLMGALVRCVDAANAARNLTPLQYLSREYWAARRLHAVLGDLVDEHRATGAFALLDEIAAIRLPDGRPLPAGDMVWMLLFALWNAVIYTGTYGFWTLIDALTDAEAVGRVRAATVQDRRRFLEHCFLETLRLHPISWQLRMLTAPVVYEEAGRSYQVPAGHLLGAYSYEFSRDPTSYTQPEHWRPARYERGEATPSVFGRGAFSCVAGHYSKLFIRSVLERLLMDWDIRLLDPAPPKTCRVHLLYPDRRVRARITPRRRA